MYDRFGHDAFTSAGSGGQGFSQGAGNFSSAFSDVFEDLFGDIMGGQNRRGGRTQSRGSDLRYDVSLDLEDANAGVRKRITVPTSAACSSCGGRGTAGGAEPVVCPTCRRGWESTGAARAFHTGAHLPCVRRTWQSHPQPLHTLRRRRAREQGSDH